MERKEGKKYLLPSFYFDTNIAFNNKKGQLSHNCPVREQSLVLLDYIIIFW